MKSRTTLPPVCSGASAPDAHVPVYASGATNFRVAFESPILARLQHWKEKREERAAAQALYEGQRRVLEAMDKAFLERRAK